MTINNSTNPNPYPPEQYNETLSELYHRLKDNHLWLKDLCRKLQFENKNLIHRVHKLEEAEGLPSGKRWVLKMEYDALKEECKLWEQRYHALVKQQALSNKWRRYRFQTRSVNDYRPLVFNPKYPWWCSGYGNKTATIVAFLPASEDLKKYWDDAFDIEYTDHDSIVFTSRFPKPDYYTE